MLQQVLLGTWGLVVWFVGKGIKYHILPTHYTLCGMENGSMFACSMTLIVETNSKDGAGSIDSTQCLFLDLEDSY